MKKYKFNFRGKIQLFIIIAVCSFIIVNHVNYVSAVRAEAYEEVEPIELILAKQRNREEYIWDDENDLIKISNIEYKIPEIELTTVNQLLPVIKKASAKTYEDYKLITCKSSPQYDMIYNKKMFTVKEDGFLVTEDGFYAVALGSYFGTCGSKYIMITDEGNEIPVILLDLKQDKHTDENNFLGINGDIIEFVVDSSKMPKWKNGYCYGGNFNNIDKFKGNVIEIQVVERYE